MIKFYNVEEAKQNFADVSADPEATPEQKTEALNDYMEALQQETENKVLEEARTIQGDNNVLQSRGQNVLTSEERKFFNAVVEKGGFTDEDILPKTTQERVFEDIERNHPFLRALNIQNLGAVTEFIFSDPEGAAVWGDLFDEIKGQLNSSFRKEDIKQAKLTAFIPIAKDMLKLGPNWVERYVRTILSEAMSFGLERGFIEGGGSPKGEPVGLLKDVNRDTGAISDKETKGTLTFKPGETVIDELRGVTKQLAKQLDKHGEVKDQPRQVEDRIVMVTNPFDTFDIQAKATIQNASGAYVTNLPFNPTITESKYVPEGKVLFFVKDQYIAAFGGEMNIKRYKETLALEDADVFIAKQYATGRPVDNNAAVVYDLDADLSGGQDGGSSGSGSGSGGGKSKS